MELACQDVCLQMCVLAHRLESRRPSGSPLGEQLTKKFNLVCVSVLGVDRRLYTQSNAWRRDIGAGRPTRCI